MQLLRWNNAKPIQGHDTRPASSTTERGWMSRKSPPSGRRRSILLTSPFIDQAIALKFRFLSIRFTSVRARSNGRLIDLCSAGFPVGDVPTEPTGARQGAGLRKAGPHCLLGLQASSDGRSPTTTSAY